MTSKEAIKFRLRYECHFSRNLSVLCVQWILKSNFFCFRPNASNGLWLCTLLPLSYMTNTWKHKTFVQFQGKVSTIIAFGLFLQTLVVLSQLRTNSASKSKFLLSLPAAFTSFLIWICLNQGLYALTSTTPPSPLYQLSIRSTHFLFVAAVFSLFCGTSALLFYGWLYVYLLRVLPQSFTFGEASVVAQGFVLFLLNVGLRLFDFATYNTKHDIDDITFILQVWRAEDTLVVARKNKQTKFRIPFL